MPDFLLEIGCEEIPARMIDDAREFLKLRVFQLLKDEENLLEDYQELPNTTRVEDFSTPRRLAVLFRGVRAVQLEIEEEVLGPSAKVAFKDGEPTAAALAFAKKAGVAVSGLKIVTTPKGEYLAVKVVRKGRKAGDILAEVLPKEIKSLYWPKTMYWRSKSAERFVRPVRWILAMVDDQVLPFSFGGVTAGKKSRGHRVLSPNEIEIDRPQQYEPKLLEAKVIASSGSRKSLIRTLLIHSLAGFDQTLRLRQDDRTEKLLEKVTNLTEFPSVIVGRFDSAFLDLPEIVLETVMRDHQNYFAVESFDTKQLAPNFLAVLNTDGDPQGLIRHGNERVLRARFNDARFFWQTDQKQTLRERVELLKHVTFQKDLGSYYDKTMRVQRLASWLCEIVKQGGGAVRPGVVHKAACLAKADLTTELVKEFTELQGIVGGLYARVQRLDDDLKPEVQGEIAKAIYDHYKPQSMEDGVPRTIEGAMLSVADKADTIAGMFALGLIPSGSKDPFALRRQANGIVRTIAECKLPFRLSGIMNDARARYQGSEAEKKFSNADYAASIRTFFRERAEFYLKEAQGYAYDVVKAVLATGSDDIVDAAARAKAVGKVRGSADFESISVAFKRTKNILRQAEENKRHVADRVDLPVLREDSEKELATLIPQAATVVEKLRAAGHYQAALMEIAKLRPAVDKFFDKVMVMVDDDNLRANRLALLQTLVNEFSTIADFSEIVTEGKESTK